MRLGGNLRRGVACGILAMLWAGMVRGEDVPFDTREAVQAYFAQNFLRPQTNIWKFESEKPYLGADKVVCGRVNFEAGDQQYVGFHQFYAIIHEGGVSLGQLSNPAEDTTGARANKLEILCGPP